MMKRMIALVLVCTLSAVLFSGCSALALLGGVFSTGGQAHKEETPVYREELPVSTPTTTQSVDVPTTTTTVPVPTALVSPEFIFPHSSSAYLTETEVRETLSAQTGYSPTGKYAQDAINEIYARHGYVFKTDEIQAYYETKSWYTPDPSFDAGELNTCEKHNIELLKTF